MGGSEHGPQPAQLPPAVLAYIGDAVFELLIREMLISAGGHVSVRSLHRRATALVCAPAQAGMARALGGQLTGAERDILRRGRNVHSGHVPAGAESVEYRLATGLESLVGYLYLGGQIDRLRTLLAIGVQALTEGDSGDEG